MAVALAVFALCRVRRESRSAADDLRRVPHRIRDAAEGATVDYLRDGKTATISLVEQDGHGDHRHQWQAGRRHSDGPGRAIASTRCTMVLAAAIPLEHAARIRRVSPTSASDRV